MKHKGHIIVNKPLQFVADCFANPDYLGEYQDNFIRKDFISGEKGKAGAVSKMYYKFGKKGEMELTETITKSELPHTFEAFYHHKHMDNTMICNFTAIDDHTTRYDFEYEYTRINWVMPKLMAILFPSMYKKPAEKWLSQFKAFVERQ